MEEKKKNEKKREKIVISYVRDRERKGCGKGGKRVVRITKNNNERKRKKNKQDTPSSLSELVEEKALAF